MAGIGRHHLKDGRTFALRWATPDDVPAIARLFIDLSPESFRSRFHGGAMTPALATRLARVDRDAHMACVVAAPVGDPDHVIAEARYVGSGNDDAEIGLTVADDYQGTGLGQVLLSVLVGHAREAGLRRLHALVSVTNGAMLHLLEPFGWVLTEPTDLSVACLEISPAGQRPSWPDDVTGCKILVEQRGWYESAQTAALREAGAEVRQCAGPRPSTGRTCPLVTTGRCELAEQADLIIPALPADDQDCAAILAAHQARWPDRIAR